MPNTTKSLFHAELDRYVKSGKANPVHWLLSCWLFSLCKASAPGRSRARFVATVFQCGGTISSVHNSWLWSFSCSQARHRKATKQVLVVLLCVYIRNCSSFLVVVSTILILFCLTNDKLPVCCFQCKFQSSSVESVNNLCPFRFATPLRKTARHVIVPESATFLEGPPLDQLSETEPESFVLLKSGNWKSGIDIHRPQPPRRKRNCR